MRYLADNPWRAVTDPSVVREVNVMQVDKAPAKELSEKILARLTRRCALEENVQDRTALALILLLGDSGIRREEVAGATCGALLPSRWRGGVYELTVLGKRNVKRMVPVSERAIGALRAHWRDHGMDVDAPPAAAALISPVDVPEYLSAARKKHDAEPVTPAITPMRSTDC